MDLVGVLLEVEFVLLEPGDFLFHALDLDLVLFDLGIELVFGLLEGVGTTLELFLSALHLIFLVFNQTVLLNQVLQLGLLLVELELELIVFFSELGLGSLGLGERLDFGGEVFLEEVLLLEHLLHIVLGAH